ncbi:MAG: hypothetical protein WBR32_16560 [Pseudolabrys sp.]
MSSVDGELRAGNGNGNGASEPSPSRGGKTRLLSLDDLDRRTRAFQTAHDMKHAIIADLGGAEQLSTLELIQAENAAVDAAVLRDLQVRWLRGDEVEASVLATIENVFNRTAAMLGTKRRTKDVLPSLDQYAAMRSVSTEDAPA